MIKKLRSLTLASIIVSVLTNVCVAQLINEYFEGITPPNLPAGWSVYTGVPATDSTDLWLTGDSAQANSLCAPGFFFARQHTNFAYTNDGRCDAGSGSCNGTGGVGPGCNKTKDYLEMPSFGLTGLTGYQLKFASFHDKTYGGDLFVQVSLNGSAWSNFFTVPVDAAKWVNNTVSLAAFNGITTVSLRFLYDDGGVWASGVAIDDVVVEKAPPDMGVTAITAPITTCGLSSAESVIVKVKNFGIGAYDSIPVAYTLNGGTPIKDTIYTNINAGDSLEYTFAVNADLAAPNSYSFKTWTEMPGDNDKSNDSANRIVFSNLFLDSICIFDTGTDTACGSFSNDMGVDGYVSGDTIPMQSSDSVIINASFIQSLVFSLYMMDCLASDTVKYTLYLNAVAIGTYNDISNECTLTPLVYPKKVTVSDSAILNSAFIKGKNVFSVAQNGTTNHYISGYSVDVFASFTANTSTTNITCKGDSNGTASVFASGGSLPLSYLWNDPASQTNDTATGLAQGNYSVITTDNNGCKTQNSVIINESLAALVTTMSSSPETVGGNKGSAVVGVSGGATPYTFLWDDPASQVNDTASGLSAGTYHVTLTDANGCMVIDSATVGIIDGIKEPYGNSYPSISPNPFTGDATLKYMLDQNSEVRIELFNIIGKKIETIVNDNQKKGNYKYIVADDQSVYPPGIYLIKFTLNGEVSAKKLMKLR